MNPAEIVVHVVNGKRGDVIFDPLRKRVGQPGVSAHLHSQREILAFDKAGADVLRIGLADHNFALTSDARRGAVSRLRASFIYHTSSVNLPHDGIVHVASKGRCDRMESRSPSVVS
jgi:hypothetical protein